MSIPNRPPFGYGAVRKPRCVEIIVLAVISASPAWAELRVGVSAVEITPTLCHDAASDARQEQFDSARNCYRWVHLAGFSPYVPFKTDNRLAAGVHDPLWARALAIEGTNGETVVLVATDLPGLGSKHANHIRRRVEKAHGVPFTNVIIHSTHTHAAPDASGYWSTLMPGHNRRYTDRLREQIYQSIERALRGLQPAEMKVATTTHVSCHSPRTRQLKTDPDCHLPDINNQFDDASAAYDHFLIQRDQRDPIVRNTRIVAAEFISPTGGETIATLVNWHNHPDTLGSANRLISSDYPHYLREYVEQARGGTAVYVVGTLGNQIGGLRRTPVPLWNEQRQRVFSKVQIERDGSDRGPHVPVFVTEGMDKVRSIGYEVAHTAVTSLDTARPTANVTVGVQTQWLDSPVDNVLHVLATWSVWYDDVAAVDRPRYYWPRCWGLLGCARSDVSLIRVGDLSLITAPGEIDPAYFLGRRASTADYGDRWGTWHFPAISGVDQYMPGTHHAAIGSANDYLSYMIPTSDNVGWWNMNHPNHYEDGVTIGKHFGDDVFRTWLRLLGVSTQESLAPVD